MKNPFRIQWNSYFYQYHLLDISKRVSTTTPFQWLTYWNHIQSRDTIQCQEGYLDWMSRRHARGYDIVMAKEEDIDENTALTRLSILHANDWLR